MNVNKITDSVTYCGVNDRVSDLFERLWKLPYGVSYNSYVVRGSAASAIIDGSDSAHTSEFIHHIEDILDGGEPDYLVVNHIEPDHSGSIPLLTYRFPKMKIVGNAKTLDMMEGFYSIHDRFVKIEDNVSLDLGGKTLRFVITPMIHWPETMMTYLEEEKVLFSGDAFGCFGALNGAVVDDFMPTDLYFREAYRYYACIVAKYGQFVENAFGKTGALPIEYICSTHGPVWHSKVAEISGLYSQVARWEGEKGVVIAYGSMYGNTAAMAERIASELSSRGVREIFLFDVSHTPQSMILSEIMRLKGLILVSPTYNSEIFPPVDSLISSLIERGIKNRVVGFAGSYSWGPQAVRKMIQRFEKSRVDILEVSPQMKQGMLPQVLDTCSELADAMVARL